MRLNFRLKIRGLTFFGMLAHTQTLEGITSLQKNGKHYVFWDLEFKTLKQVKETLSRIQLLYKLSNIYVTSDIDCSYRAWCFSEVSFNKLLHILIDTEGLDYSFFYYTVKRKKATLRVSNKRNREPQKIVAVLPSYYYPISNCVEKVIYDTGTEKKGKCLLIGKMRRTYKNVSR